MTTEVAVVFAIVYAGMFLGELPRLQLDRTGIALLGALTLIGTGAVSIDAAVASVDVHTLALLFGLMVLSAQLRLGGFYRAITTRFATLRVSPFVLLGVLIAVVGALSAIFTNDVICLAVTPVVIEACRHRDLKPVPYLVAVACAANIGSAATLIGNPQNMLIGQMLKLSFSHYLLQALAPSLLGLVATWLTIAVLTRRRWAIDPVPLGAEPPLPTLTRQKLGAGSEAKPFDRWQSLKGLFVAVAMVGLFLFTELPRDVIALGGAGFLLMSRRLHSRDMLGQVDWPLLVLFAGLFVVNGAIAHTGLTTRAIETLRDAGADLQHPAWLFAASALLSNIVSNVPAVMLLLPAATHPLAGPALALASTLAGNLIIVGSIANIIVVDVAAANGVAIGWKAHARLGVPVTLVTLAIAAAALALLA